MGPMKPGNQPKGDGANSRRLTTYQMRKKGLSLHLILCSDRRVFYYYQNKKSKIKNVAQTKINKTKNITRPKIDKIQNITRTKINKTKNITRQK